MMEKLYIIYIHDDLQLKHLETNKNLLETCNFQCSIKVVIIFNKMELVRNLSEWEKKILNAGSIVYYESIVYEGIQENSKLKFITKPDLKFDSWQKAFDFVLKYNSASIKVLHTLSHSNGVAINSNSFTYLLKDITSKLMKDESNEKLLFKQWRKKVIDNKNIDNYDLLNQVNNQYKGAKKILFKRKKLLRNGDTNIRVSKRLISLNHFFLLRLTDRLFISEFSNYFNKNEICFDLILMNNCYTGTYDNLYNLRKTAKFIIFSPAYVQFDFINPNVLYSSLSNFSSIDEGKAIIIFKNIYQNFISIYPNLEDSFNILLVKSVGVDQLNNLFNKILQIVLNGMNRNRTIRKNILNKILKRPGNFYITNDQEVPFIDIFLLIDAIWNVMKNENINQLIDEFRDQFNEIQKDYFPKNRDTPSNGCISIYFPTEENFLKKISYVYSYFVDTKNPFCKDSLYTSFLTKLYVAKQSSVIL